MVNQTTKGRFSAAHIRREPLNQQDDDKRPVNDIKWSDAASLLTQQTCVLLTTPYPQCEIVFASDEFLRNVGYQLADVIGKNPGMFQGHLTTPASTKRFHDLLSTETDGVVQVLNYHRTGKIFTAEVRLTHLRNDRNDVTGIIGIQKVLSPEVALQETLCA